MCDCEISTAAFGDFAIADVFESVAYWATATNNTLDALTHACAATRRHLAHSPNFVDAVFVCRHGCHIRCYTPRKRLTVQGVKFEAVWRLHDYIHHLKELSLISSATISEDGLMKLLSRGTNVTKLDISDCYNLTDACATTLSRLPLNSLNISGCSATTDRGLKEISRCPLIPSVDDRSVGDVEASKLRTRSACNPPSFDRRFLGRTCLQSRDC